MRSPTRPPAAADPASRRSVFAVVLGNAVEFFDFGVYATFAVMIGRTFFPPTEPSSACSVGHRVRRRLRHPPLGAVLIGAYADRAGRKPAMLLTLFLMALGTGGIAVLLGYDSIGPAAPLLLVLTRLLQGLAWGGEAGPATTYILEAAPPHKRGTYACWQVVAQGIAAVAAGLMGYLLTLWLDERQPQEWGWRIPSRPACWSCRSACTSASTWPRPFPDAAARPAPGTCSASCSAIIGGPCCSAC
ncbi:MFS transporter [Pseudomonas aeruginosa]|nr:MFS transporter [Pseudomonas aeruginosa]